MKNKFDFGGWATKNDLKCSDGRTIRKDAFKDNDGKKVPLVWSHDHKNPDNVLGHAILENREDGVYAYCTFNDTPNGQKAKILVAHGDIETLSIWANNLVEKAKDVLHGTIREVSLVLSGANPGAVIDNVAFAHGDDFVTDETEAIIWTGIGLELKHEEKQDEKKEEKKDDKELKHAEGEKTLEDVFNTLNDEQKNLFYAMAAQLEGVDGGSAEHSNGDGEGENILKHNVFDKEDEKQATKVLTHDQFTVILADAKKNGGSFRDSYLAHAGEYGIGNIEYLFPDAQNVNNPPAIIRRDQAWVKKVLGGARHTPFSRIKSMSSDWTVETARARGYIKGATKKEEFFAVAKRVTTPTTVYQKAKLDRDDMIDVTDMNVVVWMKGQMKESMDEELARAALISDGRQPDDADKINETNIRPVWTDDAFYSHKVKMASTLETVDIIDEFVRQRVNYKGSGNPTLFTTTSFLTEMLLLKDSLGRKLFSNIGELMNYIRVSDIVEVPLMEDLQRVVGEETLDLIGIMLNMSDYTFGADRGGELAMFDDFDLDVNQYKYLLETRCSGCLTAPKSALVFEQVAAA